METLARRTKSPAKWEWGSPDRQAWARPQAKASEGLVLTPPVLLANSGPCSLWLPGLRCLPLMVVHCSCARQWRRREKPASRQHRHRWWQPARASARSIPHGDAVEGGRPPGGWQTLNGAMERLPWVPKISAQMSPEAGNRPAPLYLGNAPPHGLAVAEPRLLEVL